MQALTSESSKPASYWRDLAKPYSTPQLHRSVAQLGVTFGVFLALWVAAYLSLQISYLLTLALSVPAACFVVRLFMIQHDCGHASFFQSKRACNWVGFCLGVITLTPYQYWRQTHNYHHSHSGDLDFRGLGDILTKTVAEYESMSWWGKLRYRLYRNPLVLLGIGPAFHFLIKHRYPWDIPGHWKEAWRSVWLTNLALAVIILIAGNTIGYATFFMVQAPITLIACTIGVWLFYVQHQFEDTYWHRHKDWNYFEAALHGSSYLVLPRWLQWLTANIGIHHVHHLSAGIPNYRLEECMQNHPELQASPRVTLADSWRLLTLTLWDEADQQLISFRQHRKRRAAGQPAPAAPAPEQQEASGAA